MDNYFHVDIDVRVAAEVFTTGCVRAAVPLRKTFIHREQRVVVMFDKNCHLAKKQSVLFRTLAHVDKMINPKQRNGYEELLRQEKRLYCNNIVFTFKNIVDDSSLFWNLMKALNLK